MDARVAYPQIESAGGRLAWNDRIGHIDRLVLRDGNREIAPLHRAPWIEDGTALPDGLAPVERGLSGDFLCAPFGASDVEDGQPHGSTANAPWVVGAARDGTLRAEADGPSGSRVTATLTLAHDAPVLYQMHHIDGGTGGVPVAHHPMIRCASGGRLCCSPKRIALTPDDPLEPGRHVLCYPARGTDLRAFPGRAGPVDLTKLPIAAGCEDFVTLVEAEGATLGWTALLREAEDDLVIFLKDPRVLPVTMLWHSNGGRNYAPWNGRHTGVLGIEDGCAPGPQGHRASREPNAVREEGVVTALPLAPGTTHRIVHSTVALARPAGWGRIAEIRLDRDKLIIEGPGGEIRCLPFRTDLWEDR